MNRKAQPLLLSTSNTTSLPSGSMNIALTLRPRIFRKSTVVPPLLMFGRQGGKIQVKLPVKHVIEGPPGVESGLSVSYNVFVLWLDDIEQLAWFPRWPQSTHIYTTYFKHVPTKRKGNGGQRKSESERERISLQELFALPLPHLTTLCQRFLSKFHR